MVAFEWRDAIDGHVSDFKNQRVASCFEGVKERGIESIKQLPIMAFLTEVFESVHRIRGIVTMVRHGRKLRDFLRRKRGFEGREMRKVVDLNVTLRRRKRFNFLSFVDETISKSAG